MSPYLRASLCAHASFEDLRPGGDERDRTADPLLARQVLSQLSYTPMFGCVCPFAEPWKNNQSLYSLTLVCVRALIVLFRTP